MKTFRLLIVALLLAASASAQRYERRAMRGEYSPTVYLISVQEVDTIYNYGPYAMQQAALNRMAMDNATQDYIETHRPGFQQVEKPQFVFATKNNRFSFSLGGFVSLRVGFLLLGLGCRGLHLVGVRRQYGSRRGQGKTNGQHQSGRTSAQFVDFSHVPSSFNCCRVSGFACRP